MERYERYEEYLKNVSIPMVGVFDEKINEIAVNFSPVATITDYYNGYYAGFPENVKVFVRHMEDITDFTINPFIVDSEGKELLKTLKQGEVISFDGTFTITKNTVFHSDMNEIYYKLKPTGMFNLKKVGDNNAAKKLVGMWEKRLQRYILTTKQKSFEELFTSSIKDMILIGASPNTAGVYLACLLFQGDKSFYVDDNKVLTGWSEEDIKKGLNELEEIGEVLVDPVYELVDSEFLPPYFHQNNDI